MNPLDKTLVFVVKSLIYSAITLFFSFWLLILIAILYNITSIFIKL